MYNSWDMKDSRIGESLWMEWTGDGLDGDELNFYTESHVDLENDLVRRALASSLQRDGIAVSLGEGYKYAESADPVFAHAGYIDGDRDMTICDEYGTTESGDFTNDVREITLVKICLSQ